jgi:hypothetical protein
LVIVFPFLAIFAVFLTGAFGFYFSSDDVGMLLHAAEHSDRIDQLLVSVGRWLNALLIKSIFPLFPTIESLAWIRVINACLLIVFAAGLAFFISRLQPGIGLKAAFIACMALATPSTMTMLAWAQHVTVLVGALLVLGAYGMLLFSETKRAPARMALASSGSIMLFLAASINQQLLALSAVLFFLMIYFSKTLGIMRQRAVAAGLMTAGGYLMSFFAMRFFVDQPGSRTSLVSDVPGKVLWFFNEPLPNAALAFVFPRLVGADGRSLGWLFACIAVLVIAALIVSMRPGEWRTNAAAAAIFVMTIPAAYGPVLLVSENWASFRSLWPLQMLFAVTITAISFDALSRAFGQRAASASFLMIYSVALAGWAVQLQSHVRGPYMAEANSARLQILNFLSENSTGTTGGIRVAYPMWFEANTDYVYYDDIGGPIVRAWTVQPLILLLAKEHGFEVSAEHIQRVEFDERPVLLGGDIRFIDLTNFAGRSRIEN